MADVDVTFDDNLFAILKDCKVLPKFLDAVFGFLRRRTDFYVCTNEPDSPVGLPAGLAEALVKQAFFKWQPSEEPVVCEEAPEVVIETENGECAKRTNADEAFTSSESYNGAVYSKYSWSQTITDVDVIVKVPENVATRDLSVTIQTNKISVRLKNDDEAILLEGDLCNKCKHLDAIWSLDARKLEIHLDKTSEIWWDCLVTDEPKLDLSKLDCSRPYEELSQEAQAKIEELTWNQERKRLGLPTSDELVMQEKLRRAWSVEGSPFSGPYDPNAVVFN